MNDLRIPDPFASRFHCSFTLQGDTYFLVDHRSANGVLYNGARVVTSKAVSSAARIDVGTTALIFVSSELLCGLLFALVKHLPPKLTDLIFWRPRQAAVVSRSSDRSALRNRGNSIGDDGDTEDVPADHAGKLPGRRQDKTLGTRQKKRII